MMKRRISKHHLFRQLSLIMCLSLLLSSIVPASVPVFAAGAETDAELTNAGEQTDGGFETDDGLCPHHPVHTESCGYVEGGECEVHQHTEECYGYICGYEDADTTEKSETPEGEPSEEESSEPTDDENVIPGDTGDPSESDPTLESGSESTSSEESSSEETSSAEPSSEEGSSVEPSSEESAPAEPSSDADTSEDDPASGDTPEAAPAADESSGDPTDGPAPAELDEESEGDEEIVSAILNAERSGAYYYFSNDEVIGSEPSEPGNEPSVSDEDAADPASGENSENGKDDPKDDDTDHVHTDECIGLICGQEGHDEGEHTDDCGYQEAAECTFDCPICDHDYSDTGVEITFEKASVEEKADEESSEGEASGEGSSEEASGNDKGIRPLAGGFLGGRLSLSDLKENGLIDEEDEKVETVIFNGEIHLLDGVTAKDADGSEYPVEVFNVIDETEQSEVELGEDSLLEMEMEHTYLVVYIAKDGDETVAAAERVLPEEEEEVEEKPEIRTMAYDPFETITTSGEYLINDYLYKRYVITGNIEVTLKGSGTIDASQNQGDDLSVITIQGGAKVTLDGPTIKGGQGTVVNGKKGSGTDYAGMETRDPYTFRVGGGVFVENGTFTLQNGTISGNEAQRGGGIFVNKGQNLIMTGGTVENNQTVDGDHKDFAGEGGGIFVYGVALIKGGRIINNTCNSKTDLGGGGLYINNGGVATLVNAKITENEADGFGGGIAGCCHGATSLVATEGVALYGNTANGTKHTQAKLDTQGSRDTAEIVDHYNESTNQGINKNNARDFYTAGTCIVSNYMAGGGSANYSAKFGSDPVRKIADSELLRVTGKNVGLTAEPSDESIAKAPKDVLISENHSTVHGGGMGCNGSLYFGSTQTQEFIFKVLQLNLMGEKQLNGVKLASVGDTVPGKKQYTFELLDENKKVIKTAKNDLNGDISFVIDEYRDDKELTAGNTLTFYVREKKTAENTNVVYDQSLYRLKVVLRETTESQQTVTLPATGGNTKNVEIKFIRKRYEAQSITVVQVTDENGTPIQSGGNNNVVFNNKSRINYAPEVEKKVAEGADYAPKDTTFTFRLYDDKEKVLGAVSLKWPTEKKAQFTPIEYT